jgi:hypothetical protein
MRSPAVLLLFAALSAPVVADTVHLTNGNKFEEVVAERMPGEVRIRMPYGEIVLPDRVVARVERSRSVWQTYAELEIGLRDAGAAREWLELALWADDEGYQEGMRRALLRAAEIDPQLRGLAPLMARIGHILDPEVGQWLAEANYMRRRGYRQWGDHWLPGEEYAARFRAHQEARKARREQARQERIARAIEALVVAELAQATEPAPAPQPNETRGPVMAIYPGVYFPFWAPSSVPPVGAEPPDGQRDRTTFDDLAGRQPGSLFPIQPPRHRTSIE